jgi:hypothetical protein
MTLAASVGCDNKAEECKAVVNTIDDDDAALKGISLSSDDFGVMAKNLKAAADIVDKVATDLAAQKVTNAELAKESTDYQAFAKGTATELRGLADLLTPLQQALDKIGPMARTFSGGLKKLDARCSADAGAATAADCQAIATAMKDAPDQDAFKFDKDLKEDAAAFGKFAAELKALQLKDAELTTDLGEVVKGLGSLQEIMQTMVDLKPKFDASGAALQMALAKEEPIERHINETCGAK